MFTGGTAVFRSKEKFLDWYANLTVHDLDLCYKRVYESQPYLQCNSVKGCAREMLSLHCGHMIPYSERDIQRWEEQKHNTLTTIREFLHTSETFGIPLQVGEWHEDNFAFLYLGNPERGIIVVDPEEYLEYVPTKNYGDWSPAQVRASLMLGDAAAQMDIVPMSANMLSPNQVRTQAETAQAALDAANASLKALRDGTAPELAELKAELDRAKAALEKKQTELMAELDEKKRELAAKKEQLENQIYLLDSQIYNILCFAGETVKFGKIKSGANAPDSTPIVIYQKLHFLDEDMGRLASIYDIQWNELSLFEQFLANSPIAQDTFVQAPRCVSLVRLSKDGKTIGINDRLPYTNMLEKYEYYHGKTIGILIRNGDNIYVGWTDDKRIHIEDDLIVRATVTEVAPAENGRQRTDFEIQMEENDLKAKKKVILDGLISRSFVYNILQGVVERTPILPLPKGVTLGQQSEHVIYSMADGWITDNRFGSFTAIVERCNANPTKGDMILMMQHLRPIPSNGAFSRKWENDRGRGEMNRTHDVHANDCTIYPINLIEYDEPVHKIRYRSPDHFLGGTKWYEHVTIGSADRLSDNCEILEEYDEVPKHVFISLVKRECWESNARANFEVESDEYINLTYLNSVWLEWVITNKTLGSWRINGEVVNYAYAIKYLKTALDFIRKREVKEKALLDAIDPSICATPEWQVALSEWKLEKGVREVTAYQAKRFAKAFFA